MTGVSYAGGIELVTAPRDKRIDAIAPIIAWHSLLTSLYKEETVKGGWASRARRALGIPTSKGRLDPHITSAFTTGAATGTLSAEDRAWFDSRGPSDLVKQLTIPTFIVEGTADTLFTLKEAITNYEILKANSVPAKMMWFCGGHGVCLTGAGPTGHIEAGRRRLAEALRRAATPRSTPARPSSGWPTTPSGARPPTTRSPPGAPITATGSGTLALNPADAASGTVATAGRAVNAVNVPSPRRPPPRSSASRS